eukprot:6461445-Amphidinium_carterae.1
MADDSPRTPARIVQVKQLSPPSSKVPFHISYKTETHQYLTLRAHQSFHICLASSGLGSQTIPVQTLRHDVDAYKV